MTETIPESGRAGRRRRGRWRLHLNVVAVGEANAGFRTGLQSIDDAERIAGAGGQDNCRVHALRAGCGGAGIGSLS